MIYEWTIPQFTKMLRQLNTFMGKAQTYAETRKFDVEQFTQARLFIDQLTFAKQIHIACDTAKLFGTRLTGKTAPVHDDNLTSWKDLRTRIEDTIQYLGTLTAADFKGADDKQITTPRWEGKWLTGLEYTQQHALPNLYFHITTAYSILRANGVEVGKKDFLGEMPYKK